jgi:hypothetical protein
VDRGPTYESGPVCYDSCSQMLTMVFVTWHEAEDESLQFYTRLLAQVPGVGRGPADG